MRIAYKSLLALSVVIMLGVMLVPTSTVLASQRVPPPPVGFYHTHWFLHTRAQTTYQLWDGTTITVSAKDVPDGSQLQVQFIPNFWPTVTSNDVTKAVFSMWPTTTVYRFGIYDLKMNVIKNPWAYICIPISKDMMTAVVAKGHYFHIVFAVGPKFAKGWVNAASPKYNAKRTAMCGYGYLRPNLYYTLVEYK